VGAALSEEVLEPRLVTREDVAVLFMRVSDEVEAIRQGWVELEQKVGSLRGRHFYGAFYASTGEYRVCVAQREGDYPDDLGLELDSLPGGAYLLVRLHGEPPAVYDRIGPTFERLARGADVDPGRPGIEYYRRHNMIDLLLPVNRPQDVAPRTS
jgi:hypothetical protein